MHLFATTKLAKKADFYILMVAYGFGLLLLNGCKDPLDLVKQKLAETNPQSLVVVSNSDSAPKAITTTVADSSTVIVDTPEPSSNSTSNTSSVYQASTYQASALPSPFRIADFIDSNTQATPIEDTQFKDQSNWVDKESVPLLSKFQYRGRMSGVNGATYGLIQRPDGIIMRVKVGQSVGQEPIRVIEITPTQINLVDQGVNPEAKVTLKRLALIAPVVP